MFNSFSELKDFCDKRGIKFADFKVIDLKGDGIILQCQYKALPRSY